MRLLVNASPGLREEKWKNKGKDRVEFAGWVWLWLCWVFFGFGFSVVIRSKRNERMTEKQTRGKWQWRRSFPFLSLSF